MTETASSIQWAYVAKTDSGRVRELNEDSYFCDEEMGLWIIADGMGGHSCGEVASAIAVRSIYDSCQKQVPADEAIQKAHEDVLAASKKVQGADGMGTTVVMAQCDEQSISVAWVGDSRAYLWNRRTKKLLQISQDHSLVERLISAGLISAAEAKNHPQRHLITQCLGSKELAQLNVDQANHFWEPDQVLLLCSDGLTEELSDSDMQQIFASDMGLEATSERLMDQALNHGGQDNITFILLESPLNKPEGLMKAVYTAKKWGRKLFRPK
ncbi:Stp1/IreP family PP2C-type Ser/Thr phosphatase [Pleionea sp. CnH1-48]|uniref:Stp1/IreP family PP2C-type Ser/Thr phosphatase n=1 Tax=Pleionea sp. CnH1-48 TaxID=2954494 RepID=UPI002097FA68|nr:Stp1/IreP family PP2C-type Ser/Thr phosphatase [Pleionea sp. CnH1-48]MCO7227396.1 Stp1/IreP family PP2C-type Ser/Thr phosphatase [Pleionea sp. CnH1-48]